MANNKDFKVKNGIKPTVYHEGVGTVVSGTSGYSLSNASYDSKSFSVASQEISPQGMWFKPDGTKMFIVGTSSDTVYQYTLSAAWDISTASYDSVSFSVSGQEINPNGVTFNPDGTKMFIVGATGDDVNEYTVTTGWDLSSTVTFVDSFSVSGQDTYPEDVVFNDDGTKMFVSGATSGDIYAYDLSVAYDVSSASYNSETLGSSVQDANPSGIYFKSDGLSLFVAGASSPDSVYKYDLTTAFDLSTATYSSTSFAVNSQDTSPRAVHFSNDGTKMYVLGQASGTVYQYSTSLTTATLDLSTGSVFEITPTSDIQIGLSNPAASGTVSAATLLLDGAVNGYDLSGAAYDSVSFSVAGQELNPFGIAFKSDGTKMYIAGTTGDDINQYTLSTAWDVSTASFDSVTFSVISQATALQGLFFKPDGTKFYVPCVTTDAVYQYTMSTAWDLSTASYESKSLSVSAQGSGPAGLYFKSDGLTLFILDYITDTVYEYTLSTAWDVSTASYSSNSFSVTSQDITPYGLWFNDTGTRFIVAGDQNDLAYQYTMTTAWDITTASYSGVSFNLASAGSTTSPTGITFKTDGTKMYSAMRGNDTIYQYTTGTAITITYDSTLQWGGGTAPDSPLANETDVLTFTTRDGGTTYQAAIAIDGAA